MVQAVRDTRDLFTSAIPAAMQWARREARVRPGDLGLLIAASAGIQVGCAVYRF